MAEQTGPELAQHAVIEAGIGQIERQEVLPIDPATDRLGRLPVAQPFAELHQRDQRQPPRRVGRLAESGVEVGEISIAEDRAEPVAQEQVRGAPRERGPGYLLGLFGNRWNSGLRAERHGGDLQVSPTLPHAAPPSDFANSVRSFGLKIWGW